MLQPHLNPAIDAHMRFRLALQVSNVQRLMQSPRSVWSVSFCLCEVRRFRQAHLFREHKVPGGARSWQDRVFWRTWVADRPAVTQKQPVNALPEDLRKLIMSFVPPEPEPKAPSEPFDVEQKASPWWQDPRMYGDF